MSASPGGSIAVSTPRMSCTFPATTGLPGIRSTAAPHGSRLRYPGLPTADGTETGWGWAWYFNRKILCSDKVQTGVFYAYNYGPTASPNLPGLWKTTDGGRTWARVKAGTIGQWTTYHAQMNSVPDNAGHLFFTAGREQNQPLYRSTDGGATWSEVAERQGRHILSALGRPADGAQYPTVFVSGKVQRCLRDLAFD